MDFASLYFQPESKEKYHSMKSGDRQQGAWERREGETERDRGKEKEIQNCICTLQRQAF